MKRICEKRSLSSIELRIELRISSVNADLGEPECYYFEEYEAPRMNPSVVAAHKRIGLLQSSTSGKGKPWKDAKVHGQDGEQDQKFGEEGFWFFKQEEEPKAPTSLGVDHSSPPKEAPCPRASQSLFFRAKGRRDNTQRRRKSSKARRSTTGLDRDFLRPWTLQPLRASTAPPRPRKPHHFEMKKEEESKLDRVTNPVEWSAPDGRLPSPDHDLASQFFGGH
ncbi:unnamed protein product [Microthlaspi erraticum]|uniref:Uncharacterized protein n=1 Tax=Microthlaspi erraticum TaxID=1685480 RepID=A0A6D2JXE6_9BRAS|nr:unnamed protein product [Microthlaspi erraticum]